MNIQILLCSHLSVVGAAFFIAAHGWSVTATKGCIVIEQTAYSDIAVAVAEVDELKPMVSIFDRYLKSIIL